jgi:arsenate reductase (thioredoxin)
MAPATLVTCNLLLFSALSGFAQSDQVNSQTVVFVCEHGSAKSVIAAAYFNRLASEKGIPYRAISRATKPDDNIDPKVKSKLAADGLDVSSWKPVKVSDKDVQSAERVITLAPELPIPNSVPARKLFEWENMPSVSQDYDRARQDIVRRVNNLLRDLSPSKP